MGLQLGDALGLSYKNSGELNKIIDNQLPSRRPAFTHHEAQVAGEAFDIYMRDILECVQALYGDPEHTQYLCFAPERHYADADRTQRLYHDMQTGKWWWATQVHAPHHVHRFVLIVINCRRLLNHKSQVRRSSHSSYHPTKPRLRFFETSLHIQCI